MRFSDHPLHFFNTSIVEYFASVALLALADVVAVAELEFGGFSVAVKGGIGGFFGSLVHNWSFLRDSR